MSQEELVKAYVDGMISRRIFIRGLVATGLSATAALAYASLVGKNAHGAIPAQSGSGTTGGSGGYGNNQSSAGAGGSGTTGGAGGPGKSGGGGGAPGLPSDRTLKSDVVSVVWG